MKKLFLISSFCDTQDKIEVLVNNLKKIMLMYALVIAKRFSYGFRYLQFPPCPAYPSGRWTIDRGKACQFINRDEKAIRLSQELNAHYPYIHRYL